MSLAEELKAEMPIGDYDAVVGRIILWASGADMWIRAGLNKLDQRLGYQCTVALSCTRGIVEQARLLRQIANLPLVEPGLANVLREMSWCLMRLGKLRKFYGHSTISPFAWGSAGPATGTRFAMGPAKGRYVEIEALLIFEEIAAYSIYVGKSLWCQAQANENFPAAPLPLRPRAEAPEFVLDQRKPTNGNQPFLTPLKGA